MIKAFLLFALFIIVYGCGPENPDTNIVGTQNEQQHTEMDLSTPEKAFFSCTTALQEERIEDFQGCISECSPAPPDYFSNLVLPENRWKIKRNADTMASCGTEITREPEFIAEKGVVELVMDGCTQVLTLDRDGKWRLMDDFEGQSGYPESEPLSSVCKERFINAWAKNDRAG